jgi:hypothetical protein
MEEWEVLPCKRNEKIKYEKNKKVGEGTYAVVYQGTLTC